MEKKREDYLVDYIFFLGEGKTTRKLFDEYRIFLDNCSPAEVNFAIDKYIGSETDYIKIEKVVAQFIRACGKSLDMSDYSGSEPQFILLLKEENRMLREHRKLSSNIYKEFVRTYNSKGNPDRILLERLKKNVSEYKQIIPHYQKLQNALFSVLEKNSANMNCLKLMWHIQDEILKSLKILVTMLDAESFDFNGFNKLYGEMFLKMGNLIYREEKILYPLAVSMVPFKEFDSLILDIEGLGTAFGIGGKKFTAENKRLEYIKNRMTEKEDALINLKTGNLSAAQIDLMLTNLPIDITYVDENDSVRYFSQGKERIFPRSPGIIGRAVQNCHPPKSIHVVQKIIDDFRAGKRDSAEFWIQTDGKFIHIRYFPLFEGASYKGVIEVSQELSHLRNIEGEKRLLDEE